MASHLGSLGIGGDGNVPDVIAGDSDQAVVVSEVVSQAVIVDNETVSKGLKRSRPSEEICDYTEVTYSDMAEHECEQPEPEGSASKKFCCDSTLSDAAGRDSSVNFGEKDLRTLVMSVFGAINLRLDKFEERMTKVETDFEERMAKVETDIKRTLVSMNQQLTGSGDDSSTSSRKGQAIVVGVPHGKKNYAEADLSKTPFGSNVTLITLNSESDYPNGVWLGDKDDPNARVRVNMSPGELLHVHANCRTAEKMALTLLDYLFDRETQASSNLSGTGKHGKKQLDPLRIYGIRCHLVHKFNIRDADWNRIKTNIDSKCRTAFRRRSKGLGLAVKGFRSTRSNRDSTSEAEYDTGIISREVVVNQGGTSSGVVVAQPQQLELTIHHGEVVDGQEGPVRIIHATEEQLIQLQNGGLLQGDFQILDANQSILQDLPGSEQHILELTTPNQ